jgi:hypothetical protein
MTDLPLTPQNWSDGLYDACRQLRQHWPHQWFGLPHIVGLCQKTLNLTGSTDDSMLALNRFALRVAYEMEIRAVRLPAGAEPRYHNRLHTADVLLALTTLLRILDAEQEPVPARPWSAALVAAAAAHDFMHPGGVNRSPFEIESASWRAVAGFAQDLPVFWRDAIETLIMGTDIQSVAANHQRIAGQPFRWDLPWCQVLLNEADILISVTAELGPGLSEALALEWKRVEFSAHAHVATPAGRALFLRSVLFSSPASRALGMHAQVQRQLAQLPQQE